ncbi:protocatechuate 3,4-dioxygenase subunit alpha [Spirillospora sp. CA-294931]|uniref:protocatechuate 3,4-dioxygenase subunit alpha n=1 Tax=Spirillospora sp. CA-294931 TaxID=3240042 RepID=UPI003D94A9D9
MHPTPSQTVGPFYGYALPFPGGADVAPSGHPGAVTVHGNVLDGSGAPVPDALLEFWQDAPEGASGSMRRDPASGGFLGRDGVTFTGFARVATDAAGHFALRTLPPARTPYLAVVVFARGLLHHLHTRVYLPHLPGAEDDPLLARLPPDRRATLLAVPERDGVFRFDVHLQGSHETVFLAFD